MATRKSILNVCFIVPRSLSGCHPLIASGMKCAQALYLTGECCAGYRMNSMNRNYCNDCCGGDTFPRDNLHIPSFDRHFHFHFHLQNIPQFLPVMRGTVSLPANRDPEVLERLQPDHMQNMCNRMQLHLNASAALVATDQSHISGKLKEVKKNLWIFSA